MALNRLQAKGLIERPAALEVSFAPRSAPEVGHAPETWPVPNEALSRLGPIERVPVGADRELSGPWRRMMREQHPQGEGPQIVNDSRHLTLESVQMKNLASHVLGLASARCYWRPTGRAAATRASATAGRTGRFWEPPRGGAARTAPVGRSAGRSPFSLPKPTGCSLMRIRTSTRCCSVTVLQFTPEAVRRWRRCRGGGGMRRPSCGVWCPEFLGNRLHFSQLFALRPLHSAWSRC